MRVQRLSINATMVSHSAKFFNHAGLDMAPVRRVHTARTLRCKAYAKKIVKAWCDNRAIYEKRSGFVLGNEQRGGHLMRLGIHDCLTVYD